MPAAPISPNPIVRAARVVFDPVAFIRSLHVDIGLMKKIARTSYPVCAMHANWKPGVRTPTGADHFCLDPSAGFRYMLCALLMQETSGWFRVTGLGHPK
jgi:hypothetical protein